MAAINVHEAFHSLRGLKQLSDEIFITAAGKNFNVQLKNGNSRLIFDMKSGMGIQAVAKNVKKAMIQNIDVKSDSIDVTAGAKLMANQVGVDLDNFLSKLKTGAYSLTLTFETMSGAESTSQKVFRVQSGKKETPKIE